MYLLALVTGGYSQMVWPAGWLLRKSVGMAQEWSIMPIALQQASMEKLFPIMVCKAIISASPTGSTSECPTILVIGCLSQAPLINGQATPYMRRLLSCLAGCLHCMALWPGWLQKQQMWFMNLWCTSPLERCGNLTFGWSMGPHSWVLL